MKHIRANQEQKTILNIDVNVGSKDVSTITLEVEEAYYLSVKSKQLVIPYFFLAFQNIAKLCSTPKFKKILCRAKNLDWPHKSMSTLKQKLFLVSDMHLKHCTN